MSSRYFVLVIVLKYSVIHKGGFLEINWRMLINVS